MSEWKKEKPIKGGFGGCMSCGYQYDIAPENMLIAVGFGSATITKNGKTIYDESSIENEDDLWTLEEAEKEALKDEDNDWRIHLVAPLSERHYQRQGKNYWVLYEIGFAIALIIMSYIMYKKDEKLKQKRRWWEM